MSMYYKAVTNPNQGIFNSPRQKMWGVINEDYIALITNSFDEAKEKAREFINKGQTINDVMVVEFVPIDTVISPSV
ncbi:hypothetical protein [Clostridium botulinum]|uniref:hypothetical protein n=1 Tax=Clostridium botulinum TaxID=1491 RepID=UPI0004DA03C6|nr:hypothetical protein [Clostridium botulinum]KEH99969.1 hypothetical protein Z952_14710 [Clostridium botulinum C/D str. BKT75002]KEI05691.1 hypothetical protein Z954_14890 [Clostridium botulinum C/D str. BKT2873]MCD3351765.1 hypothetical protein [Clostridium botulinum D/C]MCD3360691.1 hypothetical protein [Clostridium botulinum D/C]MCD3362117.1 hypothetical protein [Clostridium botulinum D/C]